MAERLPATEPVHSLVARLVYAAGDPTLAERVALRGDPISAAVAALAGGASLVVDVGMVAAGISRPSMAALGTRLHVAIQAAGADALARERSITRSAAGILSLVGHLDGAVVAIGNAPTALLALLDLIQSGQARPAAIIAMPVGFVAADESKDHALLADVPCIAVRGTRGGSALAAATANYLLRLAQDG
jgi:precorrin-8X/cobalt-precorrin-8 methylmutase